MAQTLLPFPTNMLGGFVKKAALYLPPEHRNPIMVAAQSKAKPNPLLEKNQDHHRVHSCCKAAC